MGIFRNLALSVAEGNQDYYFNLSFGDGVPISSTELEYLQSTGTQYINTGIAPDTINTKVEVKYQYLNNLNTGADSIMGSRSNGTGRYRFYPSSRSAVANDRIVLGDTVINTPYDIEVHTVIFNDENHDCYLDGVLVGNAGTSFTPHAQPMYMFALNCEGNKTYQSACRIYYCKIWKNGELVAHMKPCQNADGTLCFYDVVRKERFYNVGTGTFTYMHKAYPSALPEGYTALNYITATGAQYIDVGAQLWSNPNWIIKTTVALDEFNGDNQLLGTKNVANANYQTKITNRAYSYSFNNISNSSLVTLQPGVPITVTHDDTSTLLINKVDSTFATATKSTAALAEDVIFGHRFGAPYFSGKIYNLSLWKDNYFIRNFTPCLNEEGEAGLFDNINGVFYPSLGDLPFYAEDYESPAIPEEYEQVDYISATGTQYINTGFYPTGDTRYDIKFTNCKTNGVLFGAYNNTWTDGYGLYTNAGTKTSYYVHYNSNTNTNIASGASGVIMLDRGIARINSSTVTVNSNVLNTNVIYPLYLLAGNMDGTVEQPVICDLYYFKIYTSAGLQRDLVPVVRISDSKVGMYDRVTGEFLTSATSTDFVAPVEGDNEEDLLPADYTRLAYLRSTGTQYIDTGIAPATDLVVDMVASFQGNYDSSWDCMLHAGTGDMSSGTYGLRLFGDAYNLQVCYGMYGSNGSTSSSYSNPTVSIIPNQIYTINTTNQTLTLDGATTVGNPSPVSFTPVSQSMYLFAGRSSGSMWRRIKATLYSLKLYTGGSMVRDFIPALNSSGVAGLYDTVSGTFFTNIGSGTFQYEIGE